MSLILLLPLIIAAAYALTLPRLPTIKNVSGVAAAGKANIEGSGELGNIDVNFTGIVGAGTVTFRNKRQGVNHCVSMHVCFSDDDCFGGTCSGAFVGTCLCTGCVAEAQCDDDSMCGGLRKSCDLITDTCNCNVGFIEAGFSSQSDALTNFCNKQNCTRENAAEVCFGMPCAFGSCVCPV